MYLHVYCWQLCIDLRPNERSHISKLEQCSNLQEQQEEEQEEVQWVKEVVAKEEEGREEVDDEEEEQGEK